MPPFYRQKTETLKNPQPYPEKCPPNEHCSPSCLKALSNLHWQTPIYTTRIKEVLKVYEGNAELYQIPCVDDISVNGVLAQIEEIPLLKSSASYAVEVTKSELRATDDNLDLLCEVYQSCVRSRPLED